MSKNESRDVRICLADDHQVVSDAITCLLENQEDFCVVGQANNGVELLEKLNEWSPDIVILDVAMPRMNGIEVARVIEESHPGVRSIILSMHADQENIYQALNAGSLGYVLKESAGSHLVKAIRSVKDGHIYLCQTVTAKIVASFLELKKENLAVDPLANLSERECEVLRLHSNGHSTSEIAERLHISGKTVETYRYRLKEKLGIRETAGLVKFAIRHGLTSLD